jgi:23S rRNA (adenine2503-C2)-methyltransferase
MNLEKIETILKSEPAFRLKQVLKAVFHDLITDWKEATILSKNLREILQEEVPLDIEAEMFSSKDGRTVKAAIMLEDGLTVETVLMKHTDRRNAICVSSQVGCPLGCLFCVTGEMGFKRNLNASEILDQVLFFARYLKKENEKITNVVFMGMGEPFLNWENVSQAIQILNDDNCFGIGARKISVSTAGITEGIKKLAEEFPQINLAISLHAPDDKLRSELMPVNKKYPLRKILQAIDDYIEKTNRKVMFEYVMLSGVNDSEEQAKELVKILKKTLYMVNLIVYNPNGRFKASSSEKMKRFKAILEKADIFTTQRYRFGTDIEAACGQLASNVKRESKRKIKSNIALIGMAGVGKSFIGKHLAEKMGYSHIETDQLMDCEVGKIGVRKEQLPDDEFIRLEGEVILGLGDKKSAVVDTGGSAIYSKRAMESLKSNATVVYLKDRVENIKKRFGEREYPHLVGIKRKSFDELFWERDKLYEKYADSVVDVSGDKKLQDIMDEIILKIKL